MKNFLIDLILVVLILVISTTFFSKDSLYKNNIDDALTDFEVSVSKNEVLETTYLEKKDEEENKISKTTKYISDTTVEGLKAVVGVFSEIVDIIFN